SYTVTRPPASSPARLPYPPLFRSDRADQGRHAADEDDNRLSRAHTDQTGGDADQESTQAERDRACRLVGLLRAFGGFAHAPHHHAPARALTRKPGGEPWPSAPSCSASGPTSQACSHSSVQRRTPSVSSRSGRRRTSSATRLRSIRCRTPSAQSVSASSVSPRAP